MEQLNYCRQVVKQMKAIQQVPSMKAHHAQLQAVVDLSLASEKFMLPTGGSLLEDLEWRALDDDQPLRLPYTFCALEWRYGADSEVGPGQHRVSKRVLFCREDDGAIRCTPVLWLDAQGAWALCADFGVKCVGALGPSVAGRRQVTFLPTSEEQIRDPSACADEVTVLMGFLNAVACSNVRIHKLMDPRRVGKKVKAALPFDSYHVLTIDAPNALGKGSAIGGHRSPREHLRRGHIRRLDDGRRIWVNATVVAAGRGAGVVTKDYAVRGGKQQ